MKPLLPLFLAGALAFGLEARAATSLSTPPASAPTNAPALKPILEKVRRKFVLPALGAAVVRGQKIVAAEVVGMRRDGVATPVLLRDKWHIGSCTKSMTATLAALAVDQDILRWNSTLAEVFPERTNRMLAPFREVTLEQLLQHRAGLPGDLTEGGVWKRVWDFRGSALNSRLFLLNEVLAQPPVAPPGQHHLYSNAGYSLAGAMLERAHHRDWEELMEEQLFKPLGMTSAGFGAPATPGQTDQPWGHRRSLGLIVEVPPGPAADNPVAISPAGRVHCSLEDLARYAAFHLQGARSEGSRLRPQTYAKLYEAGPGQDYALGWVVLQRGWGGGKVLMHNGSNTSFYTVIWLAPLRDTAFVITTNMGGDQAAAGCDAMAVELVERFLGGLEKP